MAAAPVLALLNPAPPSVSTTRSLDGAVSVAARGPDAHTLDDATLQPDVPPPTDPPTTVAVTATTPATLLRTARATPPTTAVRRTTTTVKAAPARAATTSKPAPRSSSGPSTSSAPSGRSQSGGATWYDAAPPGTCAHQTLPMGTVVTIRSQATGKTATCRVDDRGPYANGMIIDLAKDVFSQLAPLSQGVVQVTISW